MQALLEFMILKATLALAMAASLIYSLLGLYNALAPGEHGIDGHMLMWTLLRALAIWLTLGLIGLIVNSVSFFQAIRALRGKWPGNGISGRIANHFSRS